MAAGALVEVHGERAKRLDRAVPELEFATTGVAAMESASKAAASGARYSTRRLLVAEKFGLEYLQNVRDGFGSHMWRG